MNRVHILSPGFTTPNGRAFLFPLVAWRAQLENCGISCRIFTSLTPALTECDALLVDSKFHRDRWQNETSVVVDEFAGLAARCRVIYCDTTDSTGWLQTELLPIVHVYAKAQLIKDRAVYLKPMYGHRSFADYYHRTLGTTDRTPEYSQAVTDAGLLAKLRLSWNSGLADYSLYGPVRMALYHWLPSAALLRAPRQFVAPARPRPRDISCRFGLDYPRETIAIQRKLIRKRMAGRADTGKLSRRAYFRELETSKVIVSPFGYGEITLKDFEVFLTGGLLLKPDMTHMETWPDLFRAGETMLAHRWDLSDFDETVDRAVADYARLRSIAERGQVDYCRHVAGETGPALFAQQFQSLVKI